MKKKLICALATGFFAVVTVSNMNMLESNNTEEVSWESISVMAEASVIRQRVDVEPDMEGGGGPCPSPTYGCSSGGPGASSCSVTVDTLAGGVTYSVTCNSACYACCNGYHGARCFKD